MTPVGDIGSTTYLIATSEADFRVVGRFFKRMGEKAEVGLIYPVVVAKRGRRIVGALGTMPNEMAIVAGPLAVDLSVRALVGRRLIELYEHLLVKAKVPSYVFAIAKKHHRWRAMVEKLGYIQYGANATSTFHRRELR